MRPYPAYKESGVEWLGEVPEGWEVRSIKSLSPVFRGASPRPIDDPKYFDDFGQYAWVRIADVSSSSGYLTESSQTLSELGSSLSVKLEPGSLFVSIAGSVGKACITNIKACIHDGFVYFPYLKIPAEFLKWIFDAGNCYAGLGKMGTQLNLNTDTIGAIKIALPPHSELNLILSFLDKEVAKIDALVAEQRRLIALLAEKRQAVISHAVTKGLNPATPLKPSGIDWLGDTPEGWEVVPLKYLGNFGAGAGFPHDQQGLEGEELPFFKVNALGKAGPDGVLIPDTDTISRETANRLRATIFPSGTIVFAKIGAALLLGRIRTLPCASCIDNNMMALTVSGEHCTAFVKLAMSTLHFDLISNPGTVPSLNEGQIADQRIALPPMTEQIAIAEYISQTAAQLDALTSAAQSAISLLQERRAALISAAVTGKIDLRPHFAQSLSEPEIA
jgi:type I restriction enzyme S subunit